MTGTETQERPWTAREDAVVRCCAGPHDAAWEGWGRLHVTVELVRGGDDG